MRQLLVFLPVLISGCSGARACRSFDGDPRGLDMVLEEINLQEGFTLSESLEVCASQRGDHPLNILVLSGGGQNGAFGAGFLEGWSHTGSRPVFDVVTGISTGALMATQAFLGTPDDDAALRETYTTVSKEDIISERSFLSVPFSNSLHTAGPLEELIAQHITEEVIGRVSSAYDDGRRLFVGTVDLDAGTLQIWDLTLLANKHGADGMERYRTILLAAASAPVIFPPVFLDERMHVDGGVREQVFLRQFMLKLCDTLTETRVQGPGQGPQATVYVIVNGKLGVEPVCVDDSLPGIALRSLSAVLDGGMVGNLFRVYAITQKYGLDFRLESIPPGLDLGEHGDSFAFHRETMNLLYEEGQTRGKKQLWSEEPPTAEDIQPFVRQ